MAKTKQDVTYRVREDELAMYVRQSDMQGWASAPADFTPGRRVLGTPAGAMA